MRARLRRGMPWKRKSFLFFFFSGPPPGKEKGKIIFTKKGEGVGCIFFVKTGEKAKFVASHEQLVLKKPLLVFLPLSPHFSGEGIHCHPHPIQRRK